jgi:YggT family protein
MMQPPCSPAIMLYQIVSLLLEVAVGLLAGTCLLRLYMQHQRIPISARSGNPLGKFIFALTDWIVLPLRRLLPAAGRWDLSSLAAAFLLELARNLVLRALRGEGESWSSLPVLTLFDLLRVAFSLLSGLVIAFALLSWVQAQSPLSGVLERVVHPVLAPIRRVLPLVGGVDLSPLVLLVLIQIAGIVLGTLQAAVLW